MQVVIDTSQQTINWAARGAEEIAQNCLMLIRTLKYEVAYDRTLGIRADYLDLPLTDAVPLVTAQLYKVIDEREPRATVQDVHFIGVTEDGELNFKVVIDI
jgi:uncharacterized protein